MPAKLTREVFIQRARKIYGDKYDYSKVVYINKRTKVLITCLKHGDFLTFPSYLTTHNLGCSKCKRDYYFDKFIKMSKKVHGNKYSYEKVDYKDSAKKIIIICPVHGEFLSIPTDHIYNKAGCSRCSGIKKLTTEEFIVKANKVHNNKYDYSKVNYINAETEVTVICPVHGDFYSNPNHHVHSKAGCPKCNSSKAELLIGKILDDKKTEYIIQKTFNDCRNPKTNTMLKFDFYLPKYNILIEFNGMQHYKEVKRWHIDKLALGLLQYRDNIKKEYAISHGYKYLVIKYDEKNIEQVLLNALGI